MISTGYFNQIYSHYVSIKLPANLLHCILNEVEIYDLMKRLIFFVFFYVF